MRNAVIDTSDDIYSLWSCENKEMWNDKYPTVYKAKHIEKWYGYPEKL